MSLPKIIGLSGSLRSASLNTASLRKVAELAAGKADMTIYPLDDIPMYNGDMDVDGGPDAVQKLKAAIEAADALIIATPEYNYSVPAVLKNAIDWCSRPAFNSVLKDKPVGIFSASMAFTGGVRAQAHLKTILGGTLSKVVACPEVLVASAHKLMDDNNVLADETTITYLGGLLDATLADI